MSVIRSKWKKRSVGAKPLGFGRWLWALLNSAFVLWFLSAVLLTAGGTAFSSYQTCVRESSAEADELTDLIDELLFRRGQIAEAVVASRSAADLERLYPANIWLVSKYKEMSNYEVYRRAWRGIEKTDRPQITFTTDESEMELLLSGLGAEAFFNGMRPKEITDRLLEEAKTFVSNKAREPFFRRSSHIDVKCTPTTVFRHYIWGDTDGPGAATLQYKQYPDTVYF